MLKIEHLVKAEVPTGQAQELPMIERARSLSALVDDTVPATVAESLSAAIEELQEVSGYQAVSETLQGRVVKAPSETEWAAMSPEAKKQWAIAEAVKGCGVASVEQLRQVTNALGAFAIIPYEALSPLAFEGEEPEVEVAVKAFAGWASSLGLQSWVLAPINYYDIEKHVAAGGAGVPYAGTEVETVMMGLQMTMPVLLSMGGRIGNLETRVGGLEGRMGRAEKGIAENSAAIEQVRAIATQQQAALAQAKATVDTLTLRLANAEQAADLARRERVFNQDPLIFALPAGENIALSLTKAILGPCWGPDIDAIVAELRKLVPVEGHRAYGSVQLWARAGA